MNHFLQKNYNEIHQNYRRSAVCQFDLGGNFDRSILCVWSECDKFPYKTPPHFHVISETSSVCIKLNTSEYYLDGKNKDFLTESQMRLLNEKLKELNMNNPHTKMEERLTHWELLCDFWNGGENTRQSIRLIQPDYSTIKIPEKEGV